MGLTIGTQLGSHEITALLGKGGMGEVYRARDLKLKREVAIKILPDEFARDSDRVARFQREAEVLASLNHPNIAAIYDLQEAQDTRFLVLEMVDGETLAERIQRGPIPVEETLTIARRIAEALEAAHERGVVHRDLKPANVKITSDGKVKVLDFGLAKAMEREQTSPALSNSPTLMSAASNAGIILGTAAYMSPEQARGKDVDKRTDMWAMGCVLYEMLTGKPVFRGEDLTEILASVVKSEPDWNELPANVPAPIRKLLRRCLQKDRKRRLDSAADAGLEIDEATAEDSAELFSVSSSRGLFQNATLAWSITAVLFVIMATALGAVFHFWQGRPAGSAQVIRFSISPPEEWAFARQPAPLAVAPDGQRLAFVAVTRGVANEGTSLIWVRPFDSLTATPLMGTEGASSPFWSPDNHSIGFFAAGKLKKIEAIGGPSITLCDAPAGASGTWSNDGVIIFGPAPALQRVTATGGFPSVVTAAGAGEIYRFPFFLPDSRHFLYRVSATFGTGRGPVYLASLDSPKGKQLSDDMTNVAYSSGHLLFMRETTLMARPFAP